MTYTLNTKKIVRYGALLWLFWMVFYAFFFRYITVPDHGWAAALGATLGSYLPFAFISLGIWRLCRAVPIDRWRPVFFFLFHFTAAMLISAFWLIISYGGWYLSAGEAMLRETGIADYIGWQYLFGVITCLLIDGIFYAIINYEQFREKVLQEAALTTAGREAEIKALRMQINPHFLFNTLNSINALVTTDPTGAREMIAGLSELFRSTLERGEEVTHSVADELELTRRYLAIEQVRFGDRLNVIQHIDPGVEAAAIPVLLLQPLLENAVKHGVASHRGDSEIQFEIAVREARLHCRIENTHGQDDVPQPGAGTGLDNLKQRLALIYDQAFTLNAGPVAENRFRVEITLPLERCHAHSLPDC